MTVSSDAVLTRRFQIADGPNRTKKSMHGKTNKINEKFL